MTGMQRDDAIASIRETMRKMRSFPLGGDTGEPRVPAGAIICWLAELDAVIDFLTEPEMTEPAMIETTIGMEPCPYIGQPVMVDMADKWKQIVPWHTTQAKLNAKDGIGACDALYELAVAHGASATEAAGHAHNINGAFCNHEDNVASIVFKVNALLRGQ